MAKRVLAFICISALVGGFIAAPEAAALSAAAVLKASSNSVQVGDTVTIEVAVEQVADLYGIQFALTFDADKVEPQPQFVSFSQSYNFYGEKNECASCGAGITPLYPLIRTSLNDSGYKAKVPLAQFAFKAVKAGSVSFGLQNLKGVSSETYTNQFGRDDVKEIPILNASPITLVIHAGDGADDGGSGGTGGSGLPESNDSPVPAPALDRIRSETDPAKAAESLIAFMKEADVNDGNREAIEQLTNELLARLFALTPDDRVEINGQSFIALRADDINRSIRLGTELLAASQDKGFQPQAPAFVEIELNGSDAADLLLPSEALKTLASSGVHVYVKKSGAALLFPIESICNGEDDGVAISIQRSGGQAVTESGGRYWPAAEYTFEVFKIVGSQAGRIESFTSEVAATVEYDPTASSERKMAPM